MCDLPKTHSQVETELAPELETSIPGRRVPVPRHSFLGAALPSEPLPLGVAALEVLTICGGKTSSPKTPRPPRGQKDATSPQVTHSFIQQIPLGHLPRARLSWSWHSWPYGERDTEDVPRPRTHTWRGEVTVGASVSGASTEPGSPPGAAGTIWNPCKRPGARAARGRKSSLRVCKQQVQGPPRSRTEAEPRPSSWAPEPVFALGSCGAHGRRRPPVLHTATSVQGKARLSCAWPSSPLHRGLVTGASEGTGFPKALGAPAALVHVSDAPWSLRDTAQPFGSLLASDCPVSWGWRAVLGTGCHGEVPDGQGRGTCTPGEARRGSSGDGLRPGRLPEARWRGGAPGRAEGTRGSVPAALGRSLGAAASQRATAWLVTHREAGGGPAIDPGPRGPGPAEAEGKEPRPAAGRPQQWWTEHG